jgi:glycosyltransferase involved in cell wall biosynthesis
VRVVLIHQAFVSPGEAGGTRHFELAKHAGAAGHQFTIVASDLSYLTGQRATGTGGVISEETIQGVRVLRAFTYPTLHRSFTWRIVSFVSFMCSSLWVGLRAGPVDVVMGTSPPIFQAASAWLLSFLRRKPLLLEIRDLWPDFAIGLGVLSNPLLIWAARGLERFLYRRATHLLVNSPAYRDYLLEEGVKPKNITLIANGVDCQMFDPTARGERTRREFGLDGQFVITYAGALGLANDIPTILRAAERLLARTDIRWLLLGDGKERLRLERMARDMGLRNVLFVGARPKSEMPDFLAASDVCLATLQNIPMFRTTYPNKVFDYMAAGRPTILAIDGVIRQVIEKSGGGVFVSPGDDGALAEAVLKLRSNPLRVRAMGDASRKFVVQNFDRREQASMFVALLERMGRSDQPVLVGAAKEPKTGSVQS